MMVKMCTMKGVMLLVFLHSRLSTQEPRRRMFKCCLWYIKISMSLQTKEERLQRVTEKKTHLLTIKL